MRDQIEVLDSLQSLDMELSKIEAELDEYPKKISAFEEELKESREGLESLKGERQELIKKKSAIELELAQNEETIKKSEEKLFEIKTHKEYEALQKEIAETKRMNSDLEDNLLDQMEKTEKIESEISTIERELEGKESEYKEKITGYKEKLEELKTAHGPLVERKEEIASKVSPDIMPIYEKLKKRNGNVLALAKNEICTGCHMNIPPQLFNEVLTLSKIIQCPNCQKILYTEEEVNSEAQAG